MVGLLAEGSEPQRVPKQVRLGGYKLNVTYERPSSTSTAQANPGAAPPAPASDTPSGGLVINVGPDEFLVAGSEVRIRFSLDRPASGENGMMLRVEEGTFDAAGHWVMRRVWNGDETDYGLNFTAEPVLLKVKLGTYR